MTLTVIVPNEGDEAALKEQGIARAKDFALQFAADRSDPRQSSNVARPRASVSVPGHQVAFPNCEFATLAKARIEALKK
jgi:hypothetical protein